MTFELDCLTSSTKLSGVFYAPRSISTCRDIFPCVVCIKSACQIVCLSDIVSVINSAF